MIDETQVAHRAPTPDPHPSRADGAHADGIDRVGTGRSCLDWEAHNILADVDSCLRDGLDLYYWWREADRRGAIPDKMELTTVLNRPDSGYSFFAEAPIPSGPVAVMGDVPLVYYDQPKGDWDLDRWTAQVEEFALRYFMRVSDFRLPEVVVPEDSQQPLCPRLSWCPRGFFTREGFGFEQLYAKPRGGPIECIPEPDRFAIVDQRRLGAFDWVVGRVQIFNFNLSFPLDPKLPKVSFPLPEAQYVIFSERFTSVEHRPAPGVRARFRFGYAMLRPRHDHSVIAYGPGQFDVGFQTFTWTVTDDGSVWVRMPFVVNRPERILDLSLDPVDWAFLGAEVLTAGKASRFLEPIHGALDALPRPGGFDPVFFGIRLANLLTLGQAARRLCISKKQLEEIFLIFHFNQYYTMITGSLLTWRQIRDWLDRRNLPEWVKTGSSA